MIGSSHLTVVMGVEKSVYIQLKFLQKIEHKSKEVLMINLRQCYDLKC